MNKEGAASRRRVYRHRVVSKRNFTIVICTLLFFLAVLWIVVCIISLATGIGGPLTSSGGARCFFVDMLEERVPHFVMPLVRQADGHLHRAHPPLAYGQVCFDRQQSLVEWQFHQSYYRLYTLRDMVVRGPLEGDDDHDDDEDTFSETTAPIVISLGVHTGKRHRLLGSTLMDPKAIDDILRHPNRFYVSLEGDYSQHEQSVDAERKREIGRHNLNYAI